jgi:hypothetical protein
MCRNIKQLRSSQDPPSEEAIEAAARQYIRKISGYRKPSHANQAAFEQAITQVAIATRTLLDNLVTRK